MTGVSIGKGDGDGTTSAELELPLEPEGSWMNDENVARMARSGYSRCGAGCTVALGGWNNGFASGIWRREQGTSTRGDDGDMVAT